jgi:hypothetical protein
MKRVLAMLLLTACDGAPSCEESYQEYLSHFRSRFQSCGLDPAQLGDTPPPEECTDDQQEVIVCADDCLPLLSCAALTGSGTADGYVDCIEACPIADF